MTRTLILGGGDAAASLAQALNADGLAGDSDAVDLVVIPVLDPLRLAAASLADDDLSAWRSRCEGPLSSVRDGLQEAYRRLRPQGGVVVVVVPTLCMTGAAGLTAYAAAAEGARALAKAVARAWAVDGIRVNCVAVEAAALHGDAETFRLSVAPLVALLASGDAKGLAGATLVADGGELMLP